ncbi:Mitochondrial beta-keto-acyl synthase [Polyrhizophydium stewartii]|uniref:beta-ketoacyl-[acyl-carrier-protein] synthase I n=1 Tax=Polyrhizophydium stewartii TaxID=2732419 RepID=A0ABR4NBS6_9FUNG
MSAQLANSTTSILGPLALVRLGVPANLKRIQAEDQRIAEQQRHHPPAPPLPAEASHWDRLPAELHGMIIEASGPLTKLAVGAVTPEQLEAASNEEKRQAWEDAFAIEWQGDLRLLPVVAIPPASLFLAINSRSMHERVSALGIGATSRELRRCAIAHEWRDMVDLDDDLEQLAEDAAVVGALWPLRELIDERRTVEPSQELASSAARFGHLEVVKFLHERSPDGSWNRTVATAAILFGHLDIAEWLLANRSEGCDPGQLYQVITYRQTDLYIKTVVERGWMHVSSNTLTYAARSRSVDLMQFLRAKGGDELFTNDLIDEAASNGLEMLQWLHREFGFEPTTWALWSAAQRDDVASVRWLLETFPNVDWNIRNALDTLMFHPKKDPDVPGAWRRLLAGHSGVVSLRGRIHEPTGLPFADILSQVAALVPTDPADPDSFTATSRFSKSDERKLSPFIMYAMHAARQALADAAWAPTDEALRERTGVCMGSGIGCIEDIFTIAQGAATHGFRRVSPYMVPRILINMAGGHISIENGFKGPNHAVSTACATGAHAIGDAMRFIQYGDADVMVAGGAEASVSPLSMAGFAKARSLSTAFNDKPAEASRPFDRDRDGFVIGEGAGVVVLEELEHARRRGARIYAEIRGYGLSGDAHHMTAPPEDANGAVRAMRRALQVAGLDPAQVDYVNAHATSTEIGDLAETRAIRAVFGDSVAVSSTKGATGHLLGAAGCVEAIFAILANVMPPTINLRNLEPASEFCVDFVCDTGRDASATPRRSGSGTGIGAAITNSFGFGGTNASLCFTKPEL